MMEGRFPWWRCEQILIILEGIIPCWWREAFLDDREWLLWREWSCVWRNHPVTCRESFPNDERKLSPMTGSDSYGGNDPVFEGIILWHAGNHSLMMNGSFLRWQDVIILEGIIPWWWREAFIDDREWFLWKEWSYVWRNHPVTCRELFPDDGEKSSPMTGNDSFEGIILWHGGNHSLMMGGGAFPDDVEWFFWRESLPSSHGTGAAMKGMVVWLWRVHSHTRCFTTATWSLIFECIFRQFCRENSSSIKICPQ